MDRSRLVLARRELQALPISKLAALQQALTHSRQQARTVVSHFHSTALQNWISDGKISSNYPEHLHDGTTMFAISHYDQYHGPGLDKLKAKWEKYGFAYREGPAEQAHTR
jgi:hypothetical protein